MPTVETTLCVSYIRDVAMRILYSAPDGTIEERLLDRAESIRLATDCVQSEKWSRPLRSSDPCK
jgi:hypothetical protein